MFEVVTVGELLSTDRGISVGVMYPGSHDEQGIPLIRAADISEGHISETPTLKISKNVHHEYRRTALEGGECLLTLVGTPGIAAIVPHSMAGWNVARAVAVLRLKEQKNARFLRYAFSSPDVRNTIRNWCNTTVQPTLNLGDIKKIPISWPPIETRETITRILSGLDDKIDLNRRTNETLEAMARALFRDWFVDFGPTRAKMAGEASYLAPELWELFPDRLDDEGKPEGWHQKPISEHFSVSIGKTPPRKEREHFVSSGHGIPWLSIRDMGTGNVFVSTTSENLTPESVERFNIKIASEGTVLLSFKLTVGRVMIANQRIRALLEIHG